MSDVGKLDSDAPRRVEALKKLFNKTKTLFIDWKDNDGNREAFMRAFSGIIANPEKTFFDKINNKTWGGLAYESGATMIRATRGFDPQVSKVKTSADKHLSIAASGKTLPHTVGKAPGSASNNTFVTLVHELGHHAHFAAGTVDIPKRFKSISIYGGTNHKEQYAELFSAYMFAGPKMKKLFPAEYELVESILKQGNFL